MRAIVRKLTELASRRLGGEPAYGVGVFGKHPAWNDHMQVAEGRGEVGRVRSVLYDQGIAANISSGAWEAIDADRRLAGFDHVFAARVGRSIACGRIASSRDGVGRGEYPLVSVIVWPSVLGLSREGMAPIAVELARDALAASERAGVAEAVARASERIEQLTPGDDGTQWRGDADEYVRLAAVAMAHAVDGEELARFVYAFERDLGGCLRSSQPDPSNESQAASCKVAVRVPRPAGDSLESVLAWAAVCDAALVRSADRWVLAPSEGRWVDLLVGAPDARDLFCLRATIEAIPCATSIPYGGIDDDFRRRVADRVQAQAEPT